jgi:hypothetical protein
MLTGLVLCGSPCGFSGLDATAKKIAFTKSSLDRLMAAGASACPTKPGRLRRGALKIGRRFERQHPAIRKDPRPGGPRRAGVSWVSQLPDPNRSRPRGTSATQELLSPNVHVNDVIFL